MNANSTKLHRSLGVLATAALMATASLSSAHAALVTTRAGLGGTDSIGWGQLGADGDGATSPAAVTSTGGAAATVSNSGGGMTRFDEGAGTIAGNFAIGDQLLTNFGLEGALTIDFANPVAKVGTQLMALDYGSFSGLIQVFNSANVLLESYTVANLLSSGDEDNSAGFIGISRLAADIDHVTFLVSNTAQGHLDFAMNGLDFSATPDVGNPSVPEPATLLLVATALLGLARRRR